MTTETTSLPQAASTAPTPATAAATVADAGAQAAQHGTAVPTPGLSESDGQGAKEPVWTAPPSLVKGTREALYAADMPRDVVFEALAWLEQGASLKADELAVIDKADRTATELELRDLWGPKFEANRRTINKYIDSAFAPDVREVVHNARSAGGHALLNDPAVLQRLLGPALIKYPAGGTDNDADGSESQGVDGEIAKIEKAMRVNRKAYFADEKLQSRYRSLLAALEGAR